MIAVHLHAVAKTYHLDAVGVAALQDINLELRAGLLTVISGASGSGKTTLLNLIGGLDRPDAGRIHVAGHDIVAMDDDQLSDFRARHLGVVFQNFNLLPVLNAQENVEYPLVMLGIDKAERKTRAAEMLAAVGLTEQARRRPGELSGGQRQRVAIARALAARPQLVLADEPTANLDSQTGASIIELMRRLQREQQVSFVISSHDPQVLAAADDMVRIKDGRIVELRRADALKVAA
ncbi:ABC transporter ATP-binding protein [Mitsuaria sp. WAJ17]|uniref:ABC transporter ATP-binding protein n=1 Tax=Mitsuaria sp. WAJ17 TaxID=2761452 RepID=UPI001600802E|nr:ABC transporter ATP-binding protein [Mitsuaria sp. WAJ17]MBB2487693.1 ABC transporter ATP-binding protein [Mitsuaria sp. WAJ17]